MTMELTIAITGIIGMAVGMAICRTGIKERDQRISELEKENEQLRNDTHYHHY